MKKYILLGLFIIPTQASAALLCPDLPVSTYNETRTGVVFKIDGQSWLYRQPKISNVRLLDLDTRTTESCMDSKYYNSGMHCCRYSTSGKETIEIRWVGALPLKNKRPSPCANDTSFPEDC